MRKTFVIFAMFLIIGIMDRCAFIDLAYAQSDWTSVPISKQIVDNQTLIVQVEFRNSVTPAKNHTRSYEIASPIDVATVKSQIENHKRRLNKIQQIHDAITLDVELDTTAPPTPTPSPAEQATIDCRLAYEQRKAALEAVNVGRLDVADPMVSDTLTAINNDCQLPAHWRVFVD